MFFVKENSIYFLKDGKGQEIIIEKGVIKKGKDKIDYANEDLMTRYELECRYAELFKVEEEVITDEVLYKKLDEVKTELDLAYKDIESKDLIILDLNEQIEELQNKIKILEVQEPKKEEEHIVEKQDGEEPKKEEE